MPPTMVTNAREDRASSTELIRAERGMTTISETGCVDGCPDGGDVGGEGDSDGGPGGTMGSPAGSGARCGDPKCGPQTGGTEVSRPVEHDLPDTVLEGDGWRAGRISLGLGAPLPWAGRRTGYRPSLQSRARWPAHLQ